MQDKKDAQDPALLCHGEQVIFWQQMVFRLFLGVCALYSVICHPLPKALITLLVLACFNGMAETVFASLMIYARLKAQAEEKRKRQEASDQAKAAKVQAKADAQAAAAAQYFEFGMQGKPGQNPG